MSKKSAFYVLVFWASCLGDSFLVQRISIWTITLSNKSIWFYCINLRANWWKRDTATANWRSLLGSGKIFVKIVWCCKLEGKLSRLGHGGSWKAKSNALWVATPAFGRIISETDALSVCWQYYLKKKNMRQSGAQVLTVDFKDRKDKLRFEQVSAWKDRSQGPCALLIQDHHLVSEERHIRSKEKK